MLESVTSLIDEATTWPDSPTRPRLLGVNMFVLAAQPRSNLGLDLYLVPNKITHKINYITSVAHGHTQEMQIFCTFTSVH